MALLPGLTRTNFHNVAFEGQPQKMPDRLAYPPEVVVSEALKILKERRLPAFISGPRYRYMAAIASRFFSRKKIIEMMGKNSPALK